MKVITFNANGIRAAARKGFFDWLAKQSADVVCIQETKAQTHQLTDPVFYPSGYHCEYFDAERKGYSGTALYSRKKPDKIIKGLGWEPADSEGRCIRADFNGLSVMCLYLPSGTSGPERQQQKYAFMDKIFPYFSRLRHQSREFILCADWNICHKPIDLENWRANQKHSGFLPEERAWLDRLFDELGYIDAFREINQEKGQYTWWSNRGQAWAKNVGWRLDYHLVTPGLSNTIRSATIYKEQRFSDHAPFIMEYAVPEFDS